jgi:hypothetical protein
MSKKEKNLITVNDVEYDISTFSDEQIIVLNHIKDLGRKIDNLAFNLDQLKVGREAFVKRLADSLENEETTSNT